MSAYFVTDSDFFIAKEDKNKVLEILKKEFSTFEKYRDAGVDDEERFHKEFIEAGTLEEASQLAGWFGVNKMLNDENGNVVKLQQGEYMDRDPIDSIKGYLNPVIRYIRPGSFITVSSECDETYKVKFTGEEMIVEGA